MKKWLFTSTKEYKTIVLIYYLPIWYVLTIAIYLHTYNNNKNGKIIK